MRTRSLVIIAATALAVCAPAAWSVAGVVLVDASGGGDFLTIQDGLDAAADGDTVLVLQGVYTGVGNRDLDPGSKSLVITAMDGPDLTVVDCQEMGRGFHIHGGQGPQAVIDGFTVTGGSVEDVGAGICCDESSSPTIRSCSLTGNSATGLYSPDGRGGGLYLGEECDAVVMDCVFSENDARDGGGLYVYRSSPSVSRCAFGDNDARMGGGGVRCEDAGGSFTDCEFSGNGAEHSGGAGCVGGGPAFTDCVFYGNEVTMLAGGFSCHMSSATLLRCTFAANVATSRGGGLLCEGESWAVPADPVPAPTLTECVFLGNSSGSAGGVCSRNWAVPVLTRCTLHGNSGGEGSGLYCWRSSATVTECIISGGLGGAAVYCSDAESLAFIRRCVIHDNEGGDTPCGDYEDVLFADPLFCGASARDITLCADSPCLPAGNPWDALIGAEGEGCGPCATPVEPSTWGRVKSRFRAGSN